MNALATELDSAGGSAAPERHSARLRDLLAAELDRGERELRRVRTGTAADPIAVGVTGTGSELVAVLPIAPELRADPAKAGERGWLLAASMVGALVECAALPAPRSRAELGLRAGAHEGRLALSLPVRPGENAREAAEVVPLAFADQVEPIDRLKAIALALPAHVLASAGDFRAPIGDPHPLHVAEVVARLGGRPADEASVDALEEPALALLQPREAVVAAHDDPDPARRAARRILRRLDGMGKWGGYHTEFTHLARGFAPGNDQALAADVGERLIRAGLLAEKTSVGQRHVFLNPRRAGDIRRLIDAGELPAGLELP